MNLLCTFHKPSLLLKYFTKLNKFGIIGKLLARGALLYTFSLKKVKKEIKLKKIAIRFLNFLFPAQPLEIISIFFHMMSSKILKFYLWKVPLKELIVFHRPALTLLGNNSFTHSFQRLCWNCQYDLLHYYVIKNMVVWIV